jgi:ribonuclease HI
MSLINNILDHLFKYIYIYYRIKINWDVGNRLGVGVIFRDLAGAVKSARSLTIQTKQELVIREAIGALYAAEFECDIGVQDVILEGDSLIVVKAL